MNRAPATGTVPPWALAVVAMLSVELSSALSVNLISAVGPAGTAWLRLSMGALIFLALARPPLRAIHRPRPPARRCPEDGPLPDTQPAATSHLSCEAV